MYFMKTAQIKTLCCMRANSQEYVSRFIKGDLSMPASLWIEEIYALCYHNLWYELNLRVKHHISIIAIYSYNCLHVNTIVTV